jgi:hypothetical protein
MMSLVMGNHGDLCLQSLFERFSAMGDRVSFILATSGEHHPLSSPSSSWRNWSRDPEVSLHVESCNIWRTFCLTQRRERCLPLRFQESTPILQRCHESTSMIRDCTSHPASFRQHDRSPSTHRYLDSYLSSQTHCETHQPFSLPNLEFNSRPDNLQVLCMILHRLLPHNLNSHHQSPPRRPPRFQHITIPPTPNRRRMLKPLVLLLLTRPMCSTWFRGRGIMVMREE